MWTKRMVQARLALNSRKSLDSSNLSNWRIYPDCMVFFHFHWPPRQAMQAMHLQHQCCQRCIKLKPGSTISTLHQHDVTTFRRDENTRVKRDKGETGPRMCFLTKVLTWLACSQFLESTISLGLPQPRVQDGTRWHGQEKVVRYKIIWPFCLPFLSKISFIYKRLFKSETCQEVWEAVYSLPSSLPVKAACNFTSE